LSIVKCIRKWSPSGLALVTSYFLLARLAAGLHSSVWCPLLLSPSMLPLASPCQ
jgi:hypothetical protein